MMMMMIITTIIVIIIVVVVIIIIDTHHDTDNVGFLQMWSVSRKDSQWYTVPTTTSSGWRR